jgi:hypothetical protein
MLYGRSDSSPRWKMGFVSYSVDNRAAKELTAVDVFIMSSAAETAVCAVWPGACPRTLA